MKNILTIAGSDCSGGAGAQADLKTFSAHGTFGMSVIVAVVAENTSRVLGIQEISPDMIEQQIDAVFEDITVDAVKIGMLSGATVMKAVAKKLREYHPKHIVVDPVMVAKGGAALMEEAALTTLIEEIVPLAEVITPNIPEAEALTKLKLTSNAEMKQAARFIWEQGAKHVVIKGGHLTGAAEDILFDGTEYHPFATPRINTKNTHGTGCTFSSAIAANLGKGMEVYQAVVEAKKYITMAIEHSLNLGKGHGPTNHFYNLYKYGLEGAKDE